MKTQTAVSARRIVWLCAFIYFISYVTRINYGAVIAEMVADTGLSKSALSMALTGSFITYGTGQIVSGIFGDRFQPKHLVAVGLITSVLMNLLIPFCPSPLWMTVVWCVNGFAQSFMWPPLVKLLTACLTAEEYARDCVKVSWGSSVGTIAVYLLAPAAILLAGWKSVFFVSAACGIVGLLLWWHFCPTVPLTPAVRDTAAKKGGARIFSLLMVCIMAAIVLQGILRDGVTTWMPSYITETYHLQEEAAILTGVVLPLFSLFCHYAAGWLYRRVLKNPMLCGGTIFGLGAAAALLLALFSNSSPVLSVALSAVLTGAMHGVNLILICIVPPLMAKGGNVSTVSGVMNACTYIGSAVSTYAFPLIAENAGWSSALWTWLIVGTLGSALCLLCIPAWKRSQTR